MKTRRLALFLGLTYLLSACSPASTPTSTTTPPPPSSTTAPTSTSMEIATQSPSATVSQVEQPLSTLSPTSTPTNEPTATPVTPYTGIEGFPETWSHQFPKEFDSSLGAYNFIGVIKEISFSSEGEKLSSGSNMEATSFLLVSYYDSKGQVQEILVGSSFQDETYEGHGNAVIFGRGTINSDIWPDFYVEGFIGDNYPVGSVVTIVFGRPNSTASKIDNAGYTNELINATHTEAQFAAFAATGDPSDLGSDVLVPFLIDN